MVDNQAAIKLARATLVEIEQGSSIWNIVYPACFLPKKRFVLYTVLQQICLLVSWQKNVYRSV